MKQSSKEKVWFAVTAILIIVVGVIGLWLVSDWLSSIELHAI